MKDEIRNHKHKFYCFILSFIMVIFASNGEAQAISNVRQGEWQQINTAFTNATVQYLSQRKGYKAGYIKSLDNTNEDVKLSIQSWDLGSTFYSSHEGYEIEFYFTVMTSSKSTGATLAPNCSMISASSSYYFVKTCELTVLGSPNEWRAVSKSTDNGIYEIDANQYEQFFLYHIKVKVLNENFKNERYLRFSGNIITGWQQGDTFAIVYDNMVSYNPDKTAEEAIEEGNQADQERWDQENSKAEEAQNADNGAPNTEEGKNEAASAFEVFTAIGNAAKSGTCTLPNISAFGFELGELNLCTFSPPTWIEAATGAVATIATAWCCIQIWQRLVSIALWTIRR